MSLLQEILTKCSPELVASKEHGQIAAVVSVGRTKPSGMEVGHGTVLEVLGLAAGNALLDALYGSPEFRHVRPLLEQGRLVISSPLVMGTIQAMVPAVITQADADKLLALAVVPAPVTTQEVIAAMEGL